MTRAMQPNAPRRPKPKPQQERMRMRMRVRVMIREIVLMMSL